MPHTDFSPSLWDWDADGVRGTASRMEQLCVHALLVQLYAPELVSEGEVPPPPGSKGFGGRAALGYGPTEDSLRRPVWLGKDYQLQRQAGGAQRGFFPDRRRACNAVDLKPIHTRTYTPRTNGKVERFIKTLWRNGPTPWPSRPQRNGTARFPAIWVSITAAGDTWLSVASAPSSA